MHAFIHSFCSTIILGNLVLQVYLFSLNQEKGSSILWMILAIVCCAIHFGNPFTKHK